MQMIIIVKIIIIKINKNQKIYNNERIIIWDSNLINGKHFSTGLKQKKQIRLKLSYFNNRDNINNPIDYTLFVPFNTTVNQLYPIILKQINIPCTNNNN